MIHGSFHDLLFIYGHIRPIYLQVNIPYSQIEVYIMSMKTWIVLFILTLSLSATLYSVEVYDDIILPGQKLVGRPYRFGGTSPDGFDCSGLVTYLYKNHVPGLPRVSRQMAGFGSPIERTSLTAGDLVFFATGSSKNKVTHVAIFIGQDSLLHSISNGPDRGVTITPLSSRYWSRKYHSAVRVFISTPEPSPMEKKTVKNMQFAKGLYSGETLQGEPEGKGLLAMNNGDLYEGMFHNGLFHGQGRYIWADGRQKSGEFNEGNFPETVKDGENYLLENNSPWDEWDGIVEGDFRLWLQNEKDAFEEWKKTH